MKPVTIDGVELIVLGVAALVDQGAERREETARVCAVVNIVRSSSRVRYSHRRTST
jgi:hypothetical protein